MGRSRRAALLPLRAFLSLAFATFAIGCDAPELDTAALEEQLRADPSRGGKVGQAVALQVHFHAAAVARGLSEAPDARCAMPSHAGSRWVGELSIRRERAGATIARWTETRTLDLTDDAASLRLAATFRTEAGGDGVQAAEWRVVPSGTFLATPAADGDLWMRRDTTPDERDRLVAHGPGMLQALVAAVDGWQLDGDVWRPGAEPLRCGPDAGRIGFLDRVVASTTVRDAELKIADGARALTASWELSDRTTLHVDYVDRITSFSGAIDAPQEVVTTARDRSLVHAEQLLRRLAEADLLTVLPPSAEPSP